MVPSLLADVQVEDLAADEPPPEDVLAEAGEKASEAEAAAVADVSPNGARDVPPDDAGPAADDAPVEVRS